MHWINIHSGNPVFSACNSSLRLYGVPFTICSFMYRHCLLPTQIYTHFSDSSSIDLNSSNPSIHGVVGVRSSCQRLNHPAPVRSLVSAWRCSTVQIQAGCHGVKQGWIMLDGYKRYSLVYTYVVSMRCLFLQVVFWMIWLFLILSSCSTRFWFACCSFCVQ